MKFINYDNNKLLDFYNENGLEFDESKGYFGKNIKSQVLIENKEIIGAVSVSIYKNKNFIEALAVNSKYRNRGYGKILLVKALEMLEKPVYTISKADKFYLNNGFNFDEEDLIGRECKSCEYFYKTCFPKVVVYK